jgi:hypothetical protein
MNDLPEFNEHTVWDPFAELIIGVCLIVAFIAVVIFSNQSKEENELSIKLQQGKPMIDVTHAQPASEHLVKQVLNNIHSSHVKPGQNVNINVDHVIALIARIQLDRAHLTKLCKGGGS